MSAGHAAEAAARRRSSGTWAEWVSPMSSHPTMPLSGQITGITAVGEMRRASLREERRRERRKTVAGHSSNQGRVDVAIPSSAYGSLCPLENSSCCCQAEPEKLPRSATVQRVFGNPADLVSAANGDAAADKENADCNIQFGFPSLEEKGWRQADADTIKRFSLSRNMEQETFYQKALTFYQLGRVYNSDKRQMGWVVTFPKTGIPSSPDDVRNQLRKLESFRHACVVDFLGVFEEDDLLQLVYEDVTGAGYLAYRVHMQQLLSEGEAAKMLQMLASAVASASRSRIFLLDWDPLCVMSATYTNLNRLKIFGFGLAGTFYARDFGWRKQNDTEPRFYHSPEVCKANDYATPFTKMEARFFEAAEIWSISALTYTGLAGHPPFIGTDPAHVRSQILAGNHDSLTKSATAVQPEGISLLDNGLSRKPLSRFDAEQVMFHSWVMSQSLAGKEHALERIVDNLSLFAQRPGVMRALGKIFQKLVHEDKVNELMDLHGFVDIRGDGDLRRKELIYCVAGRREDIDTLFDNFGTEDYGFNKDEFLQANMFSQDVLSERLIEEVFRTVDRDASGEITAAELFEALSNDHPELTMEETATWLLKGEEEWGSTFDMKEFAKLFPKTRGAQTTLSKKRKQHLALITACMETAQTYMRSSRSWLKGLQQFHGRVKRLIAENDAGEPRHIKAAETIIKEIREATTKTPRLVMSEATKELIGQEASKLAGLVDPSEASGILAVDLVLRIKDAEWKQELKDMEQELRMVKTVDPDSRMGQEERQIGLDKVCDCIVGFCKKAATWATCYCEEQRALLDVSSQLEAPLPNLYWSTRRRAYVKSADEISALISRTKTKTRRESKERGDEGKAMSKIAQVRAAEKTRQQPATVGSAVRKLSAAMATRMPRLSRALSTEMD